MTILDDGFEPRALPEPVPCKGQLGLWEYEGEL